MKTPDLGHFTRSIIQSLENIKFTPSQGVCTPSPTIMVHHHHHVYGAVPPGGGHGGAGGVGRVRGQEEINSAYLAGLAAGRAERERERGRGAANTGMIPAAMYASPRANATVEGLVGVKGTDKVEAGVGDLGAIAKDDAKDDDAKSLDGIESAEVRGGASDTESTDDVQAPARTGLPKVEAKTKDLSVPVPMPVPVPVVSPSKSRRGASPTKPVASKSPRKGARTAASNGSPSKQPSKKAQDWEKRKMEVSLDDATHMAFALLAANGIGRIVRREDVPGEVFDLATLLTTLEIPVELITTPASDFCGGPSGCGLRLNARQRRTLRRSQERAWKQMDVLKGGGSKAGANGPGPGPTSAGMERQHAVRRTFSPACISYGVQPAALAEYNAGLMMHAHGMMPLSPPGPYVPMSYQVPVVGHPGLAHPHMAYGEVAFGDVNYGDVNYVAGHHHQVHRNNHSHHSHHAYHGPGRSHQRAKSRLGGTEREM